MDFSYRINPNDESIKNIMTDERFYNYEKSCIHFFDKSYEQLYQDILDDDSIVYDYIYPKNNFNKKYIFDSIKLWDELGITLHKLNIFKFYARENDYSLVDKRFLRSFDLKDASKLKISFKDIPQWDSKLRLLEAEEKGYKNIIFKSIEIPRVDKKLASTIYAHEMSHAQLLSQDGGTNSIFNEETIPVLMEYIFASILDKHNQVLKYVEKERLMSICKFINELGNSKDMNYARRVTCEKYIISSLQAIKLFSIYYNNNELVKKEMTKDINKIFNGDIILEDMLDKYDANYDKVERNIKKLKLF